jgi:phospholipid/cholesterol/gamma-HCH transport system substrate-binding protein
MSMALVGPGDGNRFGNAYRRMRAAVRRSGLLRGVTVKVLVFAVACLVIVAVLAAKIGNISFFSHRVEYRAMLADATGLQPSADVKIAGVTVGEVDGVTVHHGDALVTFSVNRSVHLPVGTKVGLQWQNVIGNQYLYLYPSDSSTMLRPGATIGLADDVSGPDIGAFLNALQPVLGAIHPQQANEVVVAFAQALTGNETQLNDLIDSAASVSHTVGSLDTQVGQVIDQLDQVFTALAQRSADVGTLVDNLDTISQSLASNNGLLDETVSNFATAAQEIATMVAHTKGNLSSTIDELQGVTGTIQANDGALASGLSTIGTGTAPYTLISNYGQWFQIRGVYTCLAGQQVCSYYDGGNPPPGSGPGGGPPLSLPSLPGLSSVPDAAGAGAAATPSGTGALSSVLGLPLGGTAAVAPSAVPTATGSGGARS